MRAVTARAALLPSAPSPTAQITALGEATDRTSGEPPRIGSEGWSAEPQPTAAMAAASATLRRTAPSRAHAGEVGRAAVGSAGWPVPP
jgi:hypothetical protein